MKVIQALVITYFPTGSWYVGAAAGDLTIAQLGTRITDPGYWALLGRLVSCDMMVHPGHLGTWSHTGNHNANDAHIQSKSKEGFMVVCCTT